MLRIDCETRETALNTIASFYKTTSLEIDNFLASFNIEEIYCKKQSAHPSDEMIRMLFVK
jgi:hypothetical protein